MPPVPYTSVLARNLRAARAVADISQADVGARMRSLGFTEWRRQTMGNAEKGLRRLTAAEIAGLALCLEVTIGDLVYPRNGGEEPQVVLPAGLVVSGRRLLVNDRSVTWDKNTPVVSEPSVQDNAALAAAGAERLMRQVVEKLTAEGWTPPGAAAGESAVS